MSENSSVRDAIVIGGGFYGVAIAIYLVKNRGLKNVQLVERESALLARASHNNQARVHNGYHYPRSFTTAFRSRINLPKFIQDWPDSISKNFIKLYAIASRNSKVTSSQFERFCSQIGAKVQPAPSTLKGLFEPRLIEQVFLVEEYAFDAKKLAIWAEKELHDCGVNIFFNTKATSIELDSNNLLTTILRSKNGEEEFIKCRKIFNCTYSGLNQLSGDFLGTKVKLKHEVAEMALIQVPQVLRDLGITVMDGSFFSLMPFPSRGLHTLSHVRYTPHMHWDDKKGIDPYLKLEKYDCATQVDRMLRDAGRYIPKIKDSKYIESLFEIKTVLVKNEGDDGRPILFEKHDLLPGCYSVLGGKIDNIYDVFEQLDLEIF